MNRLTKLNFPKVEAPTFQHVAMFRAVEAVLKTDGPFSRTCQTFLSWTGAKEDTWEPMFSLCPYCMISPWAVSSDMATEKQHTAPLTVGFKVAVQGTNFDNLGNFWGLIHYALFPQDQPARRDEVIAILEGAGVTRPVVRMQGFTTDRDMSINNENNYMMIAVGNIQFNSLLFS